MIPSRFARDNCLTARNRNDETWAQVILDHRYDLSIPAGMVLWQLTANGGEF
jgi:hypothetical protein